MKFNESSAEKGSQIFLNERSDLPLLGIYKKSRDNTNNCMKIFRLTTEELNLFFDKKTLKIPDNQGECRISLNILRDCGYIIGLCRLLNTDPETGIIGDKADLDRRQLLFGKHSIALPTISSFHTLLARQFEDVNVICLTWAATFYLSFSFFSQQQTAFIESLTIYTGLLFAALISASADLVKEKQFLSLKDEINNQEVTVYRGAFGSVQSIPLRDLVVGDVIDINQGDRVPADCILIESMSVTVDQTQYYTGQGFVNKETSIYYGPEQIEQDNHKAHPDPFLMSDSKIQTGQGRALVVAVGDNTFKVRNRKQGELILEEQHTYLEEKLDRVAKQISKYATAITAICFITQIIFMMLLAIISSKRDLFSNETLLQLGKLAIVSVALLIVAIPEGLATAISIAMALSINSLKQDEILIKNLESIQMCATLHDICVGKTGTLTKGHLRVRKYQLFDDIHSVHDNDPDSAPTAFNKHVELQAALKDWVKEAIISNTDIRVETDDKELKYVPKGQPIEVGMIRFLIDNEDDVPRALINRNRYTPKIVQLPFDQYLKRTVVVREIQGNKDTARIYVKGAPEYVLPLCTQTFNSQGTTQEFNHHDTILNQVVTTDMAKQGLKTISYAIKDISLDFLHSLKERLNSNLEDPEFRMEIERNLVYIGTFGLEDPVRDDVHVPVHMIRYGHTDFDHNQQKDDQVKVRMISGDHIETAKLVAIKSGIISFEESNNEDVCMTGEIFRAKIGDYSKIWDPVSETYKLEFEEPTKFDIVKKKLRVIARATPEDRFIIVCGIKQKGGLVGMAGSSIADAEALKKADVGFCMGSGCDVAKDNSDLVILDNDFLSVQRSIGWGRSIFENVRKFLQFQLTVNISICTVTIVGGSTLGHVPLNVVQMLWVNLIMDVLAAIALCTEPYDKEEKVTYENRSSRISRKQQIILPEMWRQIICQAGYQVIVIMILMYFGGLILFEKSINLVFDPLRNNDGSPSDRLRLDSIIFNTFVLMNLFNQINCRVVSANELNVFKTILNNIWFWLIILFELGVQQFMFTFSKTNIGSAVFGVAPLSFSQQIICWFFGVSTLLVNIAIKKIPLENFNFIVNTVDLESDKNTYIDGQFSRVQSYFPQLKEPNDQDCGDNYGAHY